MRSLSLSLFISLFCHFGWAEEHGGGGGGEGEGAAKGSTVSKDQKEYIEKTARLTSLSNRIEEHHKHFTEAVHNKDEAKDPAEKQRWIKAMNEINKDLNKDIEAYNRVKADLKLRYPNQGEQLERRYGTHEMKSVEELEGTAGLDELLNRTKKMINRKYETLNPKGAEGRPAAAVQTEEEEKPKKLRLEK